MKRSFMLASALATASLFAAIAKATPASPDPASMFVISTPAPGVINFQGTGSATFTNTQGATDSVTVGSNSSFGVTVSGSNSSDYTSTASAILDLADTTSLHHATGTASQAFNMMYSAAAANAPDDSRLTDQVSKISSVLTTSTGGGLTEAITQDLAGAFDHQAASKANSVVGISPADPGSSGVEYYDDIDGTTDIDGYNAAWAAVYTEEYAKAYATASAAAPSTYAHDLAVTGLGTITNIDSLESSTFDASTQRVNGSTTQEGGSGTASANMTHANTTFANTSATTSATAFAQAFNGGNAANEGNLNVTGVSQNDNGDYVVHGTRITNVEIAVFEDLADVYDDSGDDMK